MAHNNVPCLLDPSNRSLNKWLLNVQDAVSIEMMIIEPSLEILLGPSEQKSPLGSCALTAG